jgi:copper chaperone CopZ
MLGRKTPSKNLVLSVEGMTCMGCAGRLERTVKSAPGVESVEVTLEPGAVKVSGAVSEDELAALVVKAGFVPRPGQPG